MTRDEKEKMRFVVVRGIRYLRSEDVSSYLRNLGDSEETDTRNRIYAAAKALERK